MKASVYWVDDQGGKRLIGTVETDADNLTEARKEALDELWPRSLNAASYIELHGEPVSKAADILAGVDPDQFRNQREALYRLQRKAEGKEKEHLTGILNLTDEIADYVGDTLGKESVFFEGR